jgi:hypothetical protein
VTPGPPDLSDAISPDAVAERVAACRSVARLSPGPVGEVATYLPGRRVPGVRLTDARIEVHVVARWGVRVPDVAADVRGALQPIAPGYSVDVHVDDVEVPGEHDDFEIQLPTD